MNSLQAIPILFTPRIVTSTRCATRTSPNRYQSYQLLHPAMNTNSKELHYSTLYLTPSDNAWPVQSLWVYRIPHLRLPHLCLRHQTAIVQPYHGLLRRDEAIYASADNKTTEPSLTATLASQASRFNDHSMEVHHWANSRRSLNDPQLILSLVVWKEMWATPQRPYEEQKGRLTTIFTYSHPSLAMLEAKLLIIFQKVECLSWFGNWYFEWSDKR